MNIDINQRGGCNKRKWVGGGGFGIRPDGVDQIGNRTDRTSKVWVTVDINHWQQYLEYHEGFEIIWAGWDRKGELGVYSDHIQTCI